MNSRPSQAGVALLVSLVLLLLLTIIAITAATRASMQERMAANSQHQNVAFQAAETGIQAWIDSYQSNPRVTAISTSDALSATVPYSASAAAPSDCLGVVPPFSSNAAEGGTTFQYACFNIVSTGKSCADAACADNSNPARAKHIQGHLVRY